jgi:hypothetical protein
MKNIIRSLILCLGSLCALSYDLKVCSSAAGGDSGVAIEVGNQTVVGTFTGTADWDDYQTAVIGSVEIKEAGATSFKMA